MFWLLRPAHGACEAPKKSEFHENKMPTPPHIYVHGVGLIRKVSLQVYGMWAVSVAKCIRLSTLELLNPCRITINYREIGIAMCYNWVSRRSGVDFNTPLQALITGSINPTAARRWWERCAEFMDLEHQRQEEKRKHDEAQLTQQWHAGGGECLCTCVRVNYADERFFLELWLGPNPHSFYWLEWGNN